MQQFKIELSKAIMKRKCHKCKKTITPGTVHIRTTKWIPNNYPEVVSKSELPPFSPIILS